jgi:arginase
VLVLPWHITDQLPQGLNLTLPPDARVLDASPGTSGDVWLDLARLYSSVKLAVTEGSEPAIVLSGDCMTPLAVLAGLQQHGAHPRLVWFDAHGDFHTEHTTTSGYLGGMPLAKAVGRGDMALPNALGLVPLAEDDVLLVDGRDLDPAEFDALAASQVRRAAVGGVADALPGGPVHVHVDLDVLDPGLLPGLRLPAPNGVDHGSLTVALSGIVRLRDISAVSIAATWRPEDSQRAQNDAALAAVIGALGGAAT